MMDLLRVLGAAVFVVVADCTFAQATERVDLLLVLAADVSNSIDDSKFELQRLGYADAFANPRVIEAIRGGHSGRVAVAFVEWSGIFQQKIVVDWSVISDAQTARQIAFIRRGVLFLRCAGRSTQI